MRASSRMASRSWPSRSRKARTICSAGARSPSEKKLVAVTTSGGSRLSVATWSAAVAALAGSPTMPYSFSSMLQLAGRAGLRFTARSRASIAFGASFSCTKHMPRSWWRRLKPGCRRSSRSSIAMASGRRRRWRKAAAAISSRSRFSGSSTSHPSAAARASPWRPSRCSARNRTRSSSTEGACGRSALICMKSEDGAVEPTTPSSTPVDRCQPQ